jgi:hypothetical protein
LEVDCNDGDNEEKCDDTVHVCQIRVEKMVVVGVKLKDAERDRDDIFLGDSVDVYLVLLKEIAGQWRSLILVLAIGYFCRC